MKKDMFKSVGAVVGGFFTVVFLSILTDSLLEKTGVFPPLGSGLFVPWMLALALAYRTVYNIAGGYVAAWLAPNRPMHHVKILAFVGVVGGIIGVIAGWDLSAHWYPLALAALA
jgi:hypothetical protein